MMKIETTKNKTFQEYLKGEKIENDLGLTEIARYWKLLKESIDIIEKLEDWPAPRSNLKTPEKRKKLDIMGEEKKKIEPEVGEENEKVFVDADENVDDVEFGRNLQLKAVLNATPMREKIARIENFMNKLNLEILKPEKLNAEKIEILRNFEKIEDSEAVKIKISDREYPKI